MVLACAGSALLLLGGCDRQSGGQAQPQATPGASAAASEPAGKLDRSHKGEPIPAVTLKDAGGKTLDLASLKGTPLLVNLWATWCAPCIAELPTLDRLAADSTGTLRVLTVSQDMGDTGKVAEFLKSRGGPHLEPWLDAEGDLPMKYQAGTLPTTVLYDRQGREVWRFAGGNDWAGAEAAKLIAEAR
jgi:thiol-disulfide isomerase/thioredoxin